MTALPCHSASDASRGWRPCRHSHQAALEVGGPHQGGQTDRSNDPHKQQYAKFPFTAEDNITLGQPYEDGDEAVLAAARAAGADTVIARLPKGLRTMLARAFWGGQDMSGGEWQRVAISRAFYRRGSLLVMDEPTSALDARGEHDVVSGLRALARDRAVVLVTHRLSNLVLADRIVVLKDGEICEEGDLTTLLNSGGLLAELWQLQNHGEHDGSAVPEQRGEER